MILTFEGCEIPEEVRIGFTCLEVRKYFPNPRQCFKCQRYNHSSKACRSPADVCSKCGESGHSGRACQNPLNCANCGEPHPSNDKKCFFFKLEKEIIAIQTNEKLGYREAKKRVLKNQIEPNITYASKLKEKLDNRPRQNRNLQEMNNPQETDQVESNQNTNPNPPINPLPSTQQKTKENTSKKREQSDSETEEPNNKKANTQQRMEDEPTPFSTGSEASHTPLPKGSHHPPSKSSRSASQPSRDTSRERMKMTPSSSQKGGKTNPCPPPPPPSQHHPPKIPPGKNPPTKHPDPETFKSIPSLGDYKHRNRSNSNF